jgi:hypothetical protein
MKVYTVYRPAINHTEIPKCQLCCRDYTSRHESSGVKTTYVPSQCKFGNDTSLRENRINDTERSSKASSFSLYYSTEELYTKKYRKCSVTVRLMVNGSHDSAHHSSCSIHL